MGGWLAVASAQDDVFSSFADLARVYREGHDYRIHLRQGATDLAVIAIHGGTIEPGTMELARAVAGRDHSFYAFEGLVVSDRSWDLHVTSKNFDEPRALELIERHSGCLSIHGFTKPTRAPTVLLGGLNKKFQEIIRSELGHLREQYPDLVVAAAENPFGGVHPRNVVNRAERRGTQVELSADLRVRLIMDPQFFQKFTSALRRSAERFLNSPPSQCSQLFE